MARAPRALSKPENDALTTLLGLMGEREAAPLCGRCGLRGCAHQRPAEPTIEWTWTAKPSTVASRSLGRGPFVYTASASDYFEARREFRSALYRRFSERLHAVSIEMLCRHFSISSTSREV